MTGKRAGKSFMLHGAQSVWVGRRSRNEVSLPDRSVSRRHCRLEFEGEHCWLVDNDSHNGTYVNRRRIRRTILYDGDVITVGKIDLEFLSW
jgi:pSer/pThr/pTyr-binding forkhead associated (FHA) protein